MEKTSKKKRKVGRPKKRGPKKKRKYISRKPKIDGRTIRKDKNTIDFKIVECHNGKQKSVFGWYKTIDEASEALKGLSLKDNDIVFPKEILMTRENKLKNNINEYLLLEKNRDGSKEDAMLRDSNGKIVQHKSNSNKWVIIDKISFKEEETFWVYGFDPKVDRKTFMWIYENIVKELTSDKYSALRVILFKNKIVFKDDGGNLDVVFCKTQGEAVKFYNLIEDMCKRDKIKNALFWGQYNHLSERRDKLVEDLIQLTGWSKYKIISPSTRKCKNN